MKKRILTIFMGVVFLLTSLFMFVGCGNMDVIDTNYTLNYIIVGQQPDD